MDFTLIGLAMVNFLLFAYCMYRAYKTAFRENPINLTWGALAIVMGLNAVAVLSYAVCVMELAKLTTGG